MPGNPNIERWTMTLLHRMALAVALFLFAVAPLSAQTAVPTQTPTTQITTTAPVTSDTTISVGTIAGQVLTWAATAFTLSVGSVLTAWLIRLSKLAGIQGVDLLRSRLQEVIVNGLNLITAATVERLKGQAPIVIKNAVVADTVRYVQAHAAETINDLGLNPVSGPAVEAIKARIETAIADPTVPTPAVLGGPTVAQEQPPIMPTPVAPFPVRNQGDSPCDTSTLCET